MSQFWDWRWLSSRMLEDWKVLDKWYAQGCDGPSKVTWYVLCNKAVSLRLLSTSSTLAVFLSHFPVTNSTFFFPFLFFLFFLMGLYIFGRPCRCKPMGYLLSLLRCWNSNSSCSLFSPHFQLARLSEPLPIAFSFASEYYHSSPFFLVSGLCLWSWISVYSCNRQCEFPDGPPFSADWVCYEHDHDLEFVSLFAQHLLRSDSPIWWHTFNLFQIIKLQVPV